MGRVGRTTGGAGPGPERTSVARRGAVGQTGWGVLQHGLPEGATFLLLPTSKGRRWWHLASARVHAWRSWGGLVVHSLRSCLGCPCAAPIHACSCAGTWQPWRRTVRRLGPCRTGRSTERYRKAPSRQGTRHQLGSDAGCTDSLAHTTTCPHTRLSWYTHTAIRLLQLPPLSTATTPRHQPLVSAATRTAL